MSTALARSKPISILSVKLHNRRVKGSLMRDGSIQWRFKRLDGDGEIIHTSIRLTADAMGAMFQICDRFARNMRAKGGTKG
jgi:hypothetical protein